LKKMVNRIRFLPLLIWFDEWT